MIHGDIKPEYIHLNKENKFILIDRLKDNISSNEK